MEENTSPSPYRTSPTHPDDDRSQLIDLRIDPATGSLIRAARGVLPAAACPPWCELPAGHAFEPIFPYEGEQAIRVRYHEQVFMTHERQAVEDSRIEVMISQEETVTDGGRGQTRRGRPCLWILEAPEAILTDTARQLSAALRRAADLMDSLTLDGQS